MGYIVKDGKKAWQTTELNCDQQANGECACVSEEECTAGGKDLFERADEIIAAAQKIEAGTATLLDKAKAMPEVLNLDFDFQFADDTPHYTECDYYSLYTYINFDEISAGDIITFNIPLQGIDEELIPRINKAILCTNSNDNSRSDASFDAEFINHLSQPILIFKEKEEAVRLFNPYIYSVIKVYRNNKYRYMYKREIEPAGGMVGKKLSKIYDYGLYALTGLTKNRYINTEDPNDVEDEIADGADDNYLGLMPGCFLKHAWLNENSVRLAYKVSTYSIKYSRYYRNKPKMLSLYLPKKEIIAAIEKELGK